MKKPRPEWLEKKIRASRKVQEKRDPALAKKLGDIRRREWLLAQEFKAIVRS